MREPLEAVDFVYVDSDIPPGTSVHEWRAHRVVQRATARRAKRARRRRLWRTVLAPWTFARAVARLSARRWRTADRAVDRGIPA